MPLPSVYKGMSGGCAATPLVFLAAPAGAFGVPADLVGAGGYGVAIPLTHSLHWACLLTDCFPGPLAAVAIERFGSQRDVEQCMDHFILHPAQQFLEHFLAFGAIGDKRVPLTIGLKPYAGTQIFH